MRNKYCTSLKLDTNVYYPITWRDIFYTDLNVIFFVLVTRLLLSTIIRRA